MNTAELGKRIKEARILKKMTQSEVVGDFITRNMLSQIESGTATPSVKTLHFLANVLSIPVSELMQEEQKDGDNNQLDRLMRAKQCFKLGQYDDLLILLEDFDEVLEDEFCALLARTYYTLAKKAQQQGEIMKAVEQIQLSIDFAGKGIYSNESLKTEGILQLNRFAGQLSDQFQKKK